MIPKSQYTQEIPTAQLAERTSIAEYLANLVPTPETELGMQTVNVPTFNPLQDCRRTGVELGLVNVEDAINRMCNSIAFFSNEDAQRIANNKVQWEIEGEFVLPEAIIDTIEDGMALMEDMNDPSKIVWAKAEVNAVQFAKQGLIVNNSWDLLESNLEAMMKSATCADGIVALLNDAWNIWKSATGTYAKQIWGNLRVMSRKVCDACRFDLSGAEAKNGSRPADIYRRWMKALHWVAMHETCSISNLLIREINMDQSLPYSELDAPDWVDQYTGVVDMSIMDRVTINRKDEVKEEVEVTAAMFSDGFDAEDDLEEERHDAFMTCESEWDVATPTWMEIQDDLKPSEEGNELKGLPEFTKTRSVLKRTFEKALAKGISKEAAVEMCHLEFGRPRWKKVEGKWEENPSLYTNMMTRLNDLAKIHPAKDIAYLFLSFQNEFALDEEDAELIHVHGSLPMLSDWLEVFGDEVLESVNGSFDPEYTYQAPAEREDSDHTQVERFSAQTINQIVEQARAEMAGKSKVNAFQHPSFIEGFLKCMSLGQNTVYKDADGSWKSAGQKAGWESWMAQFNPVAFKAYQAARAKGLAFDASKEAFWTATKANPVKKQETITGMKSTGLVLGSGRFVVWNIVALKFKSDELAYAEGQKAKLASLLTSKQLI